MDVYLIEVAVGVGYHKDDEVKKFDTEKEALAFIGDVATGQRKDTKVKVVYRVDTTYGKIQKMVPQLVDFKLQLTATKI